MSSVPRPPWSLPTDPPMAPAGRRTRRFEFFLGQWVTWTAELHRVTQFWRGGTGWKYWTAVRLSEPRSGIIVGRRTVHSGPYEMGGDVVPPIFLPDYQHPAWLVAWHLDRKPVFVHERDLEPAFIPYPHD